MAVKLKKWGNSLGVRIPARVSSDAQLSENQLVDVLFENGNIVIKPTVKKYRIDDLLAQCDPNAPMPSELSEWDAAMPVGNELI